MRIINKTDWNTYDLRGFLREAIIAAGSKPAGFHITIKKARSFRIHGRAYVGQKIMLFWLPRTPTLDLKVFAQVAVHEVCHTQGLRHKDMVNWWTLDVPWIEGFTLRRKVVKAQPNTIDIQFKRFQHAQVMLDNHLTVLKREQALVRKWTSKVRYYEKAVAKKAAASPTQEAPL